MDLSDEFQRLLILCKSRDFEAAVLLAETLLQEAPNQPALWHLLGSAQAELGALDAAVVALAKAVELQPDDAVAHFNLGCVFQRMDQSASAIDAFSQAIKRRPEHVQAHNNLGNTLRKVGRLTEAICSFRQALSLAPSYFDAQTNLAGALRETRELAEAILLAEDLVQHRPDDANALMLLLMLKGDVCDFSRAAMFDPVRETLGLKGAKVPPFGTIHLEDHPARLRARVERWAADTRPAKPSPTFKTKGHDKLRIGYFSANFHDHPGLYLTAGLFRHHDPARFNVYGYSLGPPRESAIKDQIIPHLNTFRQLHNLSEQQIAEIARQDGIDIAIDMDGHIKGSRNGLFAHRPAPVQISFLGFPGPIGSPHFDYIIADAIVIPTGERPHYPEPIVFMPDTYQPTDNTRPIGQDQTDRADHALPDNAVVFCCFNNSFKINAREFDIWMRVLAGVENSVLWLMAGHTLMRENLKREALVRGISDKRLIFAPRLSQADHLARHRHADLFLDTFHYNAHTTASDALWAGLPVLTTPGSQFAARVASSVLKATGLPELIAPSASAYQKTAIELGRNPQQIMRIKEKLAQNLATSALFDTPRYTKHFETALEEMFRRYKAGETPSDIHL